MFAQLAGEVSFLGFFLDLVYLFAAYIEKIFKLVLYKYLEVVIVW